MYHLVCNKYKKLIIIETPSYKSSDWSYKIPVFLPKDNFNFGASINATKPIQQVLLQYEDPLILVASSDSPDFHLKYSSDIPIEEHFPEAFI